MSGISSGECDPPSSAPCPLERPLVEVLAPLAVWLNVGLYGLREFDPAEPDLKSRVSGDGSDFERAEASLSIESALLSK